MSLTFTVYLITAIVGIVAAILLAHFAKSSSHAVIIEDLKKSEEPPVIASADDGFKRLLADELRGLTDSSQQVQEVLTKVSDVLDKEMEKRVSLSTQQLTKQYESVIKEKSQNEELAWKKFKTVLHEKRETEAVIRSIAEGLVVVDSKGKVIMMNPAAEKLLGVPANEKLGKSIMDGVKEEQLVSLVKSIPGKETGEIELASQENDTKKILRASSAVVENEHGQTVGMVSVLSDITKQKELDALKSGFVANVTHELRTPLVAIDKSVSLILSKTAGPISADQEQFLLIAQRNLKRLGSLINNLLDLSKLEAGRMELKSEKASIGPIIKESIESVDTWAKTKFITISKDVPEGMPEVNCDPNKIIQVLVNLIGNAIKFTPANGTITVEALLAAGGKAVQVSVSDTGVGIAQADLPKIFDKFYQTGERASTDIAGTGIGLSIVKEIVNLHGGKVWAESVKGSGAKFTFTVPI